MVRAAEDMEAIIWSCRVIDQEEARKFIQAFSQDHMVCEDGENCKCVEQYQLALFLADEFQKRFK